jgi:hypothetical protein
MTTLPADRNLLHPAGAKLLRIRQGLTNRSGDQRKRLRLPAVSDLCRSVQLHASAGARVPRLCCLAVDRAAVPRHWRKRRHFGAIVPVIQQDQSIEANPCHERALKRTKAALDLFDYKLIAAGERRGELVLHAPVFRGIALSAYAAMDRSEAEHRLREDMPSSVKRLSFIETAVPLIPLGSCG